MFFGCVFGRFDRLPNFSEQAFDRAGNGELVGVDNEVCMRTSTEFGGLRAARGPRPELGHDRFTLAVVVLLL